MVIGYNHHHFMTFSYKINNFVLPIYQHCKHVHTRAMNAPARQAFGRKAKQKVKELVKNVKTSTTNGQWHLAKFGPGCCTLTKTKNGPKANINT